jgi:hypothetical protein
MRDGYTEARTRRVAAGRTQLASFVAALCLTSAAFAVEPAVNPAEVVRATLAAPEETLDFAKAKLTFDKIVDPTIDVEATLAELDHLTDAARQMAGPNPSVAYRIAAVRKVIYEAGPWNGDRPFWYDLDDPLGQNLTNSLLSTYVRERRGNCFSMPILFLILADRLGVDIGLATAPSHVFVKYRDDEGRLANLETTSGAHPARDVWIRSAEPIADEAVANGVYLRKLSRKESVAHMANVVSDYLGSLRNYPAQLASSHVATAILEAFPLDVHAMVRRASANGHMMELIEHMYPDPSLLPAHYQYIYPLLAQQNAEWFERAESLGWKEPGGEAAAYSQ